MMSGEKMECLIPVKIEKEWKIVKERKRRREGRKKRKKERRKEEEGILKEERKEGWMDKGQKIANSKKKKSSI